MNCLYSKSPTNIDINKISGKCDGKCSLTYKYEDSSCVVTNKGQYLLISYDASKTTPVIYNYANYNVKEIRLYFPSLHKYNGINADGEMIIVHNSNTSSKGLLICVPIKFVNSDANIDSPKRMQTFNILNSISKNVIRNAPNYGEKTTVPFGSNQIFNLNDFVPKKPFFSYSSNEPFEPCGGVYDFVVFNINEWFVTMNDNKELKQILKPHDIDVVDEDVKLFYNPKGPIANSEQIYIDCQPVSTSDEMVLVENDDNIATPIKTTITLTSLLANPFIGIIVGLLLTFVVIYMLNASFKFFTGSPVQTPTFSLFNK
jgi:carbonic anhydrase